MKIYQATLLMVALLLFIATLAALSFPYGYFIFLRIVVCGVAIYAAFQNRATIAPFLALLLVAILFNPIEPIDIPTQTQRIVDLVTAGGFLRLFFNSLNTQNQ